MKYNKLRYYLGLRSVVQVDEDKYVLTRRFLGLLRVYYDASDYQWYSDLYSGSFFSTPEKAYNVMFRPV